MLQGEVTLEGRFWSVVQSEPQIADLKPINWQVFNCIIFGNASIVPALFGVLPDHVLIMP